MNRFFILISFALRDASKNRTILVLVIISLSVAFSAVFLSASILEGFKQTLENGATDWLGHLIIRPADDKLNIENIDMVTDELKKIDNIESFSVRSSAVLGIKYKNELTHPYAAIGIDLEKEQSASKISDRVIEGKFIQPSKPEDLIFGLTLADALVGLDYDKKRIDLGEEVEITAMNGARGAYKVGGIIDAKSFLPNWLLIFPKEEIEKIDDSQKNSEIIVKLKDAAKLDETKKLIEEKNLNINIATWRAESGYIDDIMSAVSFITVLIKRLLIVSVFVIMSVIIFINVFQKRRQIGIVKSMGASNKFVITVYIVETFIYSVLSYAMGFLIFLLIHQYSVNNPISLLIGDFYTAYNINTVWVSLIALFGAAVGGSFIPAYIAAKTKIVDVIRGNV